MPAKRSRYDELYVGWRKFHKKNPRIYLLYKRFALELIDAGVPQLGSQMIFERIKWEKTLQDGKPFKINNNYIAFYARLFVKEFPEYAHMFRFRRQFSKDYDPIHPHLHA